MLFNIDVNYFTGLLKIGKNGNQKSLYNINSIKKTTQNGKLNNSSIILNKSSFSGENISQSNNNVKSNTSSIKYYVQESQNNTQNTNQPTNLLYKDAEIEQKVKSIVTSPAARRKT